MFKQYFKPILILIAAIILCSILARTLNGNETLAEYAAKNPEIAYGESKTLSGEDSELYEISGNNALGK
ncbi:hypothetical protein [Butyrivibrio sp. AE3004]|uniref:hypothetical protein n=1 Tax=Butyrivibrio sp. AE3004 TaxID=1506994 RepID=UPI000494B479|nr:hypothetical protein [Butyrivibrio sp. AE3004]